MAKSRGQDHEFLEPDEWQSVNALLSLHRVVVSELDSRLRHEHGLAVTEFDVLITLFNAPDRRLRMTALAERVLLSPAGTTHLVTRLERDRLLRREVDPADGRKWFAVLTEDGERALREARVTHNDVLRETFLSRTTPTERRTLGRIWARMGPGPASDGRSPARH